ncbi:MAG TPA: hypothetical protein IAD36_01075 [Candidatus Scatomorpha intestinigallinarum]|uniref:Alcohol acetyltransferase n=1 Tax=Candidatus Scatomorpha intestinigallinarum TaxID=2840923 RepID=A0A9D1IYD1_9FIRM|nr:hypothetical protein [Candidatus Scatomorpha intestinigallinarum]
MENTAPELERLYFALAARIDLPRAQKRALISDFRRAAEVLVSRGLSPAEAAARLGHERLGDFYLSAPDYWYPLDDAAKIYPMSMTDGWMSVFRLSAYLDAPVEPSLLQLALGLTMPRFPFFAMKIKRGVFWHYIDGVKRRFTVQPETELPCAPMNVAAGDSQSFRVLYYGRRVSVEFFHILTDGTWGLAFLTALLLAFMTEAAHAASDESRGDISIQVPVNMRKFCPSKTLRNFSMYCSVRTPWAEAGGAERLLPDITRQLSERASETAMRGMLASTAEMVRLLGRVPLAVKRPAARIAYGFLGERAFTSTLSNLGAAKLPPEVEAHVEKLDFVLGTGERARAACAMVTLKGLALLSVTKLTDDKTFETRLLSILEGAGVPVKLSGSMPYGA